MRRIIATFTCFLYLTACTPHESARSSPVETSDADPGDRCDPADCHFLDVPEPGCDACILEAVDVPPDGGVVVAGGSDTGSGSDGGVVVAGGSGSDSGSGAVARRAGGGAPAAPTTYVAAGGYLLVVRLVQNAVQLGGKQAFEFSVQIGGKVVDRIWIAVPEGAATAQGVTSEAMPALSRGFNWGELVAGNAGATEMSVALQGFNLTFLAAVLVAFLTPPLARAALPKTTARLENYTDECHRIADWVAKAQGPVPCEKDFGIFTRVKTCSECYKYELTDLPSFPSAYLLEVCASQARPGKYEELRDEIGRTVDRVVKNCGSKPGGYYTKKNPALIYGDPPNKPDLSALCPY